MVIKTPQKSITKQSQQKGTPNKNKVVPAKASPSSTGPSEVQKILNMHTQHLARVDDTLSVLRNELREIKSIINGIKVNQSIAQTKSSAKNGPDISWHPLIDPGREYTQKEIIGITKISQPTLSMAKVRGHIVTKPQEGKRGWVVLGSDLLKWDNGRAKNMPKKSQGAASKSAHAKPAPKALVAKEPPKPVKKPVVAKKEITVPAVVKPTTTAVKVIPDSKKIVKKPVPSKPVKSKSSKPETENYAPIPDDFSRRISILTQKKIVTQTQFGQDVGLPQKVIYEIATKKRKELNPGTIQKIQTALKKYESK